MTLDSSLPWWMPCIQIALGIVWIFVPNFLSEFDIGKYIMSPKAFRTSARIGGVLFVVLGLAGLVALIRHS
jgi:hypothetical protein